MALHTTTIDDLPKDVSELQRLVLKLIGENRDLTERVRELLEKRFGRSSEKFDPDQLRLFAELAVGAQTEEKPEEPEETVEVPSHTRRKHKGHGREALPAHLPRILHDCDPPESERICSCCGKPLVRIGEEITERGEYIPARLVVNRYVRGRFACPEGHDGVRVGDLPPALIDKAKYEVSMYAHLVCAKYADHLPLNRLNGIFKRHGLSISTSLMWSMIERVAELLEGVARQMKLELLAQSYLGADETPITVLIPGQKGSKQGWIWTYLSRIGERKLAIFVFTISRSRAGPNGFLADWKGGILQADGYGGYDDLGRRADIVRAGCLGHVRRKFKDALDSSRIHAARILLEIGRIYRIESALKKRRQARGLDHEEFVELRCLVRGRRSRRVMERIEQIARSIIAEGRTLPKSPLGKAIDYMLNEWPRLLVFLDHGEVEPDNNDVERAIRHVAIGRKNWMFAGSEKGAQAAALLYSIVSSCKALGIDPEAYIADTLRAISTTPISQAASLTPWAWAARHTDGTTAS